MIDKPSLTAIILTYNEEIHIQRCISSLKDVCEEIIIIDSFSSDLTKEIALKNNVRFYQNPWVNHAVQFNWALDNCDISTSWVLRMDADEYLLPNLKSEILNNLQNLKEPINGVEIYLKRVFLGKTINRGTGKIKMIRLFRKGKARVENRWMDEHIELLQGELTTFQGEFVDDNLNSIGWWSQKHNNYSIHEAIELLDVEFDLFNKKGKVNLGDQASKKRNLKLKYVKLPLFFRSFIYFLYRYIFKLGFLEGKEGFLWHFLQGWWYRTLVDAKIFEIKKHCGNDVIEMKEYIEKVYKLKL